ncbi:hypothetical protein [Mesorhizobium sp.]|uniref:hypothetical protein n=1 Tax=Mesorhizobium sp. TaxID=1871066 RepID=UPI000FE8B450|nr:hypothetical protein [Mesorhizobium sp.]RWO23362.1 MAG: hypothetical protein EOS09_17205 [Mesorhizobium sp.]RWO29579.1 MAG: hypothetical protein EOS10_22300 [Mesorhizobium sp.]
MSILGMRSWTMDGPYQVVGGAALPTLAYLGHISTSGGTINIGDPSDDSLVVAVLQYNSSGVRTLNSLGIGGVSADAVAGSAASTGVYIRSRLVASGGVIAISWSFDAAPSAHSVEVYKINGLASTSAHDTAFTISNDPTAQLDTLAGGVLIAGVACRGANSAFSWTGADEDIDATAGWGTGRYSAASKTNTVAAAPHSVQASGGTTSECIAAASWR